MVLVLRHRRLLVKTVISVLMASLMNNSVAAWRSSLVARIRVVTCLRGWTVLKMVKVHQWTCSTRRAFGLQVGLPHLVVLLVKICLRGWIPVSRWTLTICL